MGPLGGGVALAGRGRVVRHGDKGASCAARRLSDALLHRGDEAVTAAMDRLDEPLLPPRSPTERRAAVSRLVRVASLTNRPIRRAPQWARAPPEPVCSRWRKLRPS